MTYSLPGRQDHVLSLDNRGGLHVWRAHSSLCIVYGAWKSPAQPWQALSSMGSAPISNSILTGQDWLPCRVMPIQECQASKHVMFVLTKFGSHCGHMQGWWPLGQSWLDIIVMEFFKAILMQNRQAAPSMVLKDIAKDVTEVHEQAVRENSKLDAGRAGGANGSVL